MRCLCPVRKTIHFSLLITMFTVPILSFFLLLCARRMFVLIENCFNQEPYFLNWTVTENISCHYYKTEDALPSVENLKSDENSIFFHETSCRGGLNSRQACSIESVARLHPKKIVYVFFNSPVKKEVLKRSCLAKLRSFPNVKLARLHSTEYAKGTPLAEIMEHRESNRSDWRIEHTADMLRYITLYKYGGVYLDTDMLVVKTLDALGGNWAAREDGKNANVAAAAFTKHGVGRQLLKIILNDIKFNYQPDMWTHTGPGSLHRALAKLCSAPRVRVTNTSDFICKGFTMYNPSVLYPVHWRDAEIYFKNGTLPKGTDQAFSHHMWNKLTHNLTVESRSPYDQLARKHCPTVR